MKNAKLIKYYKDNNKIIAIVIKNDFRKKGLMFFTPENFPQQLGYMNHPKGTAIKAHTHNQIKRKISVTQEVLFIKKGQLKVDLYSNDKRKIKTLTIEQGDVIFLASGGHGLKSLSNTEIIEVKQGPYKEKNDKKYIDI